MCRVAQVYSIVEHMSYNCSSHQFPILLFGRSLSYTVRYFICNAPVPEDLQFEAYMCSNPDGICMICIEIN